MSTFTPAMPAISAISGIRPRGLNRPAATAGMTILMAYLFAGLPVQVGVLSQLDITAAESSRWFFITWMTTGVFSLGLALFTRQPISVNLSLPAIIFLAGAAAGFTLPQILGANLVVGLVAIGLSALRLTEAFTRLVPAQIAIAVFAGGMLSFMLKTADLAITDLTIAAPLFGGYLLALLVTRSHMAALATAAATGFAAALITSGAPELGESMALPEMGISAIEFNASAILTLGLPLLALTAGVGNIQAIALLRSEGYKIKADLIGLAAGAATALNALGGGHVAAAGGTAVAVASAPTAGPAGSRFWAIVISSLPVIAIAFIAVPVIAAVQDLPLSFTLSVGALALIPTLKIVARKTVDGQMKAGAITALIVAALPIQVAGMPMAFLGLFAGIVVATAVTHHRSLLGPPHLAGR